MEEIEVKPYDALAWLLNVSTSVLIVFVNKLLMDAKQGYAFTFGEHHKPCSRQNNCMAYT